MNAESLAMTRPSWERFVRHVKVLARSEVGGKAVWMFVALIAFLFATNGLNVVNSYVGRDFMSALAERNRPGFVLNALLWVGVFAASTVVSVISRYVEERLALLWRTFLAQRMVRIYAARRVYFHLGERGDIGNPDERIADDVKVFTATTLSFVLMVVNGSFTVVAFSGVLWTISPTLLCVAVLYAAAGSYLTIRLGRPLIHLNYDQLDREANFRSTLIYLRENAEAIALARRERPLARRLLQRLNELAENLCCIIRVNRKVGFFTTFYNWLIQIIPFLFVAPLFFDEKVEFGVVTQSAMAFTTLVSAFSLIVTQFQSLSSFAAVSARLSIFGEAIEQETVKRVPTIKATEDEDRVAYSGLTLRSPRSGRILLDNLTATIQHDCKTLVTGSDESSRTGLFRATAGIWDEGEGHVARPALDRIMFVTERPFLPYGTLRELLSPPRQMEAIQIGVTGSQHSLETKSLAEVEPVDEHRVASVLAALGIEWILTRFKGIDSEYDWDDILSLSEQQLLVFARVLLTKPRFVLLDRPDTALEDGQIDPVLKQLTGNSISYVVFAETDTRLERYDAILELGGEGSWTWRSLGAGTSPA